MVATILLIFIIGYLAIALERPLGLDKTVSALLMAALMWSFLSIGFSRGDLRIIDSNRHIYSALAGGNAQAGALSEGFTHTLLHHLGETAEILVFLIGAMTIVEIVDLHRGFDILKARIKTRSKKRLLWILCIIAWILSAIIDNLTTAIILVTLIRKLIPHHKDRWWYAAMVVIAANAGGAWSPIGDVTTTMLWIGHKVSALDLVDRLVIPSAICMALPTFIASFLPAFRGEVKMKTVAEDKRAELLLSSRTMLFLGLGGIAFVPVFKALIHLPPYFGMMLSLGFVWLVSEYIHPEEDFTKERRYMYSVPKALARIEMSSILFFLGILLAVAALESLVVDGVGTLRYLAGVLDRIIPNKDIVIVLLGLVSAVIDNVPLVAASIGMYHMPIDHHIWHFIAYCAGTGGSVLIIGSAAGVAAMGMEKINFIWYVKRIAWLALIGFSAGAAVYLFLNYTHHFFYAGSM
ncbi:MAG: sodium:proton antiporter NhaD [Flavobacteriales bacterium]